MNSKETKNQSFIHKKHRLEVKESFYFQYKKHPTQISYLDFYLDGRIETEGNDEVGEFRITGKFKDNLIKFTKEYIGQHKVFYQGCFNKNQIDLYYYFLDEEEEESEEESKEITNDSVVAKNFNAGIVFKCQAFETEHSDYTKKKHLFVFENSKDKEKNEQAGLLFEEAGVFEVKIIKYDSEIGYDPSVPEQNCKNVVIEIKRDEASLSELKLLVLSEGDNCIREFQDFEREE